MDVTQHSTLNTQHSTMSHTLLLFWICVVRYSRIGFRSTKKWDFKSFMAHVQFLKPMFFPTWSNLFALPATLRVTITKYYHWFITLYLINDLIIFNLDFFFTLSYIFILSFNNLCFTIHLNGLDCVLDHVTPNLNYIY